MELHEITYDTAQPIAGYGPGFFRLGDGSLLQGPCLITPWQALSWQGLEDTIELIALADKIDVLLLGMGQEIAHPPAEFRAAIEAAGIGLEVMASPAACRTYNILLSEGRLIAAALLPLGGEEGHAQPGSTG